MNTDSGVMVNLIYRHCLQAQQHRVRGRPRELLISGLATASGLKKHAIMIEGIQKLSGPTGLRIRISLAMSASTSEKVDLRMQEVAQCLKVRSLTTPPPPLSPSRLLLAPSGRLISQYQEFLYRAGLRPGQEELSGAWKCHQQELGLYCRRSPSHIAMKRASSGSLCDTRDDVMRCPLLEVAIHKLQ